MTWRDQPTWRERYQAYMHSATWELKRELALWRSKRKCQRCGAKKGLEVHHLSYDRLGQERPEDLEVVCEACHVVADKDREQETARRYENARLDGWATKVYGDNWQDRYDEDTVIAHFEDWLERRGDE